MRRHDWTKIVCGLALSCGLLLPEVAPGQTAARPAELEQAMQAIRIRDYATVLELLWPLAEQGDAEAQYQLGGMYRTGRGVMRDYDLARQLLERAAAQEYAMAHCGLASLYEKGLGGQIDHEKARFHYERALALG